MEKPILLLREDFATNLAKLLNESHLPFILMEPILQNALNDMRIGIKQQYEKEKEAYEKSKKEHSQNEEN